MSATPVAFQSFSSDKLQWKHVPVQGGSPKNVMNLSIGEERPLLDVEGDASISHDLKVSNKLSLGPLSKFEAFIESEEAHLEVEGTTTLKGTVVVPDPTELAHAANKKYVDSIAAGITPKDAVRYATRPGWMGKGARAQSLVVPTDLPPAEKGKYIKIDVKSVDLQVDGEASAINSNEYESLTEPLKERDPLALRILIKDNDEDPDNKRVNGIYYIVGAGPAPTNSDGFKVRWTLHRASDFDEPADTVRGAFHFVEAGETNAHSGWVLQEEGPHIFDPLFEVGNPGFTFVRFSGAGQIEPEHPLYKEGNAIGLKYDTGIFRLTNDQLSIQDKSISNAKLANPSTDTVTLENGLTGDTNFTLGQPVSLRIDRNASIEVHEVKTERVRCTNTFSVSANDYEYFEVTHRGVGAYMRMDGVAAVSKTLNIYDWNRPPGIIDYASTSRKFTTISDTRIDVASTDGLATMQASEVRLSDFAERKNTLIHAGHISVQGSEGDSSFSIREGRTKMLMNLNGDAYFRDDVTVGGVASMTSAHVTGPLVVDGHAAIKQDVKVTGAIGVDGVATFGNDVTVTGAATFKNAPGTPNSTTITDREIKIEVGEKGGNVTKITDVGLQISTSAGSVHCNVQAGLSLDGPGRAKASLSLANGLHLESETGMAQIMKNGEGKFELSLDGAANFSDTIRVAKGATFGGLMKCQSEFRVTNPEGTIEVLTADSNIGVVVGNGFGFAVADNYGKKFNVSKKSDDTYEMSMVGHATFSGTATVTGNLQCANLFQTSDERVKEYEAMDAAACLEGINKLQPQLYSFKPSYASATGVRTDQHMGLLAQPVEAVFPHAVGTASTPTVVSTEGDILPDIKSVDYASLVAPLIGAVKELTARVQALEAAP